LLAIAGGLLGIAVAWQTLRVIIALRPASLANLDTIQIEATVLLWSTGISILTGLLFGALPALFSARGSVSEVLRNETRSGSSSITTRRIRSALVVFEIALSIALLVAAGLLVRSFAAMQRIPLGFEPRGMVSFDLIDNLRVPRDLGIRAARRYEIIDRLRAVPGVTDAAIGMNPAAGYGALAKLTTDPDASGAVRNVPEFSTIFVSSNYFRVAGIRLSEGRAPDSLAALLPPSLKDVAREVVINRGLATRLWPQGNALGAHLHQQTDEFVVVGIAEDVRVPGTTRPARSAVLYQAPRVFSFIVRTATPTADLLPALRKAILSIDPPPFIQTTTVGETFIRDALAPMRFSMSLLVAFAVVALILATVGLYGVISYEVTQRTKEIGVRVALGAEPSTIARLVLGSGLQLAVIGVAIGIVATFGATRVLSGMLFGVSAVDPATFAATVLVVTTVALLASYLPARRAVQLDPIEALRAD